jgi:uncharacterized protein (TIRG00374 family)
VGICSIKKENKVKIKPTFEKNKITKKICYSIVISLGTMVFIFSYFSYRETTVPDLSFKIIPLIAGALCMIGAWIFDALRIFITVRAWGKAILFRDSLRSVLSAYFMSSITPFMIGGGPAQMYVLGRSGLTWGEAGSLVVVCGILYQVSLLLLIVVFIFLFDIRVALQGILLKLLYTFAIFYSIIMFLLFYFLYRPQVLYRLTNWGINFVKRYFRKAKFSEAAVRAWVEEFFDDFRRGFSILFLKKPQYLAWNLLFYNLRYIAIFMVAFWVLWSLGILVHPIKVIGIQIPLNYIFSLMPTPGSSGGVEASIASVFVSYTAVQRIGIFVILWRIITFYFPLIVDGINFFQTVLKSKPTILPETNKASE